MKYKLIAVVLGFIYCLYYIQTKMDWHFIDNADLIFHEAGHVIFMFFGFTLHIGGGSLMQVLIPLVFAGYFFLRQAYFSTTAMFFWAGVSTVNVSVYAGDAVKMQLPLLTGDEADHDWNQLLNYWGLIHYTDTVAAIILILGIVFIALGLWVAWLGWKHSEDVNFVA